MNNFTIWVTRVEFAALLLVYTLPLTGKTTTVKDFTNGNNSEIRSVALPGFSETIPSDSGMYVLDTSLFFNNQKSAYDFPPVWDQPVNTGDIHGIIVMLGANPRINDIPIEQGDYIGGFFVDENGNKKCGGADFWQDTANIIFPLFKDNLQTLEVKEGFAYAEEIEFRVFSWTTGKDYVIDVIAFDTQNYPTSNKWYPLGLSCVTNMQALETIDFYISPSQNPVCYPGQLSLSAQEFIGNGGPYIFSWTSDPAGFLSSLQNPPAFTPSDTTTYFLNVTGGTATSSHELIIPVNYEPTVNAGNGGTLCGNQSINLSGTSTNYQSLLWSTSGDGTFENQNGLNSVYHPGLSDNGDVTLTFTANPLAPCSAVAIDDVLLNVIHAPIVDLGSDITLCGSDQIILNSNAQFYTTLTWVSSGSGSFGSQNSPITEYFPSSQDKNPGNIVNITVTVSPLSGCSTSSSDVKSITFQSTGPICNTPATRTKCENQPIPTSGTASNYSSILWTTSGDGTFANPTVFSTNYYPGPNDKLAEQVILTLNAFPQSPCLTPATKNMTCTIVPLPRIYAGSDATISKDEPFYQMPDATASKYGSLFWTTNGDGTFTGTTTINPKYYPGTNDKSNGVVTLTLTGSPLTGCSLSISDVMVLTISNSNPVDAGPDQSICEIVPVGLYGITLNPVSSILWSTSGDGTFEDANSLETYYYPGSNDYVNGVATIALEVIESANPGVVLSDSLFVFLIKPPTANAGTDVTICLIPTIPLNGIVTNQSSVLWTSSGNGTFSNPTNPVTSYSFCVGDIANGSVTLTITAAPNSPCTVSESDSKTVIIINPPAVNAGNDDTICQGQTHLLSASVVNYQSINWTSSGDGTFSSTGSLTPVYTPGNQDITNSAVILTLTATPITPCIESTNDAMILTIIKNPVVNAGSDILICGSQLSVSLTGSASSYSTVNWTTSGDGSFSNSGILSTSYFPGINDKNNGSVNLSLTAYPISPCSVSQSDNLIVNIQQAPVAYAGANDTIAVETVDTYCFAGVYVNNASSALWETSGTGQFFDPTIVSTCYLRSAQDFSNGFVFLTLTAVPINPCSINHSDEMKLTFLKDCEDAIADAGLDKTLCVTDAVILNGTAQNFGSTMWETSGDGTFSNEYSLTAEYFPGISDLSSGSVELCLTAFSDQNCNNDTDCIQINLIQQPTANAGVNASICQTQTLTLAGQATHYSSLLWSTSGNGSFSSTSSLTAVYTPGSTDIANETVTLTLTANAISPCTVSSSDFMVLSILKSPTANAGTDKITCQNSPQSLTGTATNYSTVLWTTSGNGTFGSAGSLTTDYTPGSTDITNGTVNLTFTANAISPCTVSTSDFMVLVIRKLPTAIAGDDKSICEGSTLNLTGTATNYLTINWSSSGNGTFSSTNSLNTVYTPGTTDITNGTVNLTLTANAITPCTVAASDFMVLTIQKPPTANAGIDQSVCQGNTQNLSGTAVNNSSIVWTTSGNGTFSSTTSLNTVYSPGTTDIANGTVNLTLTATAISPCNVNATDFMVLTVQKAPTADAGQDKTICQTETVSINGTASNYSTVLWNTTGSGTFSAANVPVTVYYPSSTDIANGTATLTLTANAISPCSSATVDPMVVTINKTPTANAGLDETICENATHQLAGFGADYNTLVWSTSGDGTFNNANNQNAIYSPGTNDKTLGSVTLTLTATPKNNCGTTVTDYKILTITKLPTANAGVDATICQTVTHQLSGSATYQASVLWTTSGNGVFNNTGILNPTYTPGFTEIELGSVTLTLMASPLSPCTVSGSDNLVLTITKSPSANVGSDAAICQTSTHNLSATATNHNGFTWSTSGNGTFSNGSVLNPTYTLGTTDISNGTVTITLTANPISPCSLPVSDEKILTIIKIPTVNAGTDDAICQGFDFTLNATASNYVSLQWTTNKNGTFSSTSSLNPVYTPGSSDISSGNATLTLTAQPISPCSGSVTDFMILTVQKTPLANAGVDQTLCQPTSLSLTGTSASNYQSLLWTTSGNGSFSNTTILSPTYYFGTTDISNGSVILTLTAAPKTPCLVGYSDDKIVIIQKSPTANAGLDATICQTDSYALSGSASNYSSVEWATNRNGTFDDKYKLNPIYYPGTSDVSLGVATLSLTAKPLSPCAANVVDGMILYIKKAPISYAGLDATICEGQNHSLNGASVANQTSFVWTTSGDGSFSNTSSLTATYYPGTNDKVVGLVILTLTVNGNSPCVAVIDTKTLTINKNATVNAGNDLTVCEDQTQIQLTGTATNYSAVIWSTNGDGTFSSTSSLTPVYTPGTEDKITGSITLSLTANGLSPCVNKVDQLTVVLGKLPVAFAGDDITVVGRATVTRCLTTAAILNSTTCLWETSGSGTFNNPSIVNPCYSFTDEDFDNGFVILTITAYPDNPCTTSDSDEMMITFESACEDAIANAGEDVTVCENDAVTLNGSVENTDSFHWTTSGNGTFANNTVLTTTYFPGTNDILQGSVTLCLHAYATDECNDAIDCLLITFSEPPSAEAGTSATICQTETYSLTGTANNYSSIDWTTSGDGTFSSANALNPVYTPGNTDKANGNVTLTLTAHPIFPCEDSYSDQMLLSILSSPVANAGIDATVCQNKTLTLNGSASHNSSVLWTTSGNGTFSSTSSLTPVYTPGNNDITTGLVNLTLTAFAVTPCQVSSSDEMVLTIQKLPTAFAGNDAIICENEILNVSGTATNYAQVHWSGMGDGVFADNSSLNTIYTPGLSDIATGSVKLFFRAMPVSPCLSYAIDELDLTIKYLSSVDAGNDKTICENESHTVDGIAENFTSVIWSTSGDGVFEDPDELVTVYTPGINDIAAGYTTLTLTAQAQSPCAPAIDELILTIQKMATANAGNDAVICHLESVTLQGEAANYESMFWSTSGDGDFDDATKPDAVYSPGTNDILTGNVTLSLMATSLSPCSFPAIDDMILNIQSFPSANAGTDITICSSENAELLGTADNYSSLIWSTSGDGSFDNPASLQNTYFSGENDVLTGIVTITFTALPISPCLLNASDDLVINIQPIPEVFAGENASIEVNEKYYLHDAWVKNYSASLWTTAGTGTFDDEYSVNTTYNPSETDYSNGNVVLTLTANPVNPCQSDVSSNIYLEFTIGCSNATANAGEDIIACVGDNVLLAGNANYYEFINWNTTGDGTFENESALVTTYFPGINDISQGTFDLCLNAIAFDDCLDATDCISVILYGAPVVDAGEDIEICATENAVALSGNATGYSSLIWTTSGDGVFDNPGVLNPVYTPGQQDIQNGTVTLSLSSVGVNNCGSDSGSLVLTIIPKPEINILISEKTICYDEAFDLSGLVSGANFNYIQWFTTNGGGFYDNEYILEPVYYPSPTVDYPQGCVGLYVVASPISPCTVSASDIINLCFQPGPAVDAGIDATVCETGSITLSATVSNYTGFEWATSGDGTFSSTGSLTAVYTPGITDILNENVVLTINATPVSPCYLMASDEMMLTIQRTPEVFAGDDITLLKNEPYPLEGAYVKHSNSITWSTNGDGTFDDVTDINTIYYPGNLDNTLGTVTLTLDADPVLPCFQSVSDEITITYSSNCVDAIAEAGSDIQACAEDAIFVNGAASYNSSVLWETEGDGYFADNSALSTQYFPGITDIEMGGVNLCLTAYAVDDCEDSTSCLTLTIYSAPFVEIPAETQMCSDQDSVTIGGNIMDYSTILWTTNGDGTFDDVGIVNTNYFPGLTDFQSGIVILVVNAEGFNGCGTASGSTTITMAPSPEISILPDEIPLCYEDFLDLSGLVTANNYAQVQWFTTNGGGFFENEYILETIYYPSPSVDYPQGCIDLFIVASALTPCTVSVSDAVTVCFHPNPTTYAGEDATICQTESFELSGSALNFSEIKWTTTGNGEFSDPAISNPVYTPGAEDISMGNVTLTLTSYAISPCTLNASDNLSLTILPSPDANAGDDVTICETTTSLVLQGDASNFSTILWQTSGDGTFDNPYDINTSYYPGFNDRLTGLTTLTLIAFSGNNCSDATDDMDVTIIHQPSAIAGADQLVQVGGLVSLSGAEAYSYGGIFWETSGDGTFSSTSEINPDYYPGVNDKIALTVTLTITALPLSPCLMSDSDEILITLYTDCVDATAFAGDDFTVCLPEEIALNGTAENFSSIMWETTGDGTFSNFTALETQYFPGIQDQFNGEVMILLNAIAAPECQNGSDELIITISQSPSVEAGSDISICNTQAFAALSGFAEHYTTTLWTSSGDGSFNQASSLTTNYYPDTNDKIAGQVTITLTALSEECGSISDFLIIDIINTPTANAGIDATICQTNTKTLSGSATDYSTVLWTTSGNGTFGSTSSLTAVYTPGTTDISNGFVYLTLTASAISPCSIAATDVMVLSIQKSPFSDAGVDATICQTGTITLSGTTSDYYSVLWTTSGDGSFSSTSSLTAVYTPGTTDITNGSANLTLTASAVSPCIVSASDFMILTIQKSPTANAGADATICQTGTKTLSGTATNYSGVLWTTSGNGTFGSAGLPTTDYTPGSADIANGSANLTLTASAVSPCVVSASDFMILTIQKSPTANAGADATICQTGTKTLSGTATNYSSVLWTTSGNGTFGSAGSPITDYTPGTTDITNGSVNLTLTASAVSPCVVSASDFMILTIQKSPTANAGADATICQNGSHTLTGTATNYSNLLWLTNGNGTFSSTSSLTATYTPGTTDITNGTVTLTLTAAAVSPCVVVASDAMVLQIQKSPTAYAGIDATICQTGTHNLTGVASNYSSLNWSTSGNGTFSSTSSLNPVYTPGTNDIANGIVTLTLTSNALSPCSGSVSEAMVLIIQKLPSANAGEDATICQTGTHTLAGSALHQASVLWTTSGNGTFSSTSSLNPVYTPGTTDISNGLVNLTLTASAVSPCSISASDFMVLSIQKSPTSSAGADATICQTETHTLNGSVANQAGILWTTSGDGSFSSIGSPTTDYTPGSTDITNGLVNLTLTASAVSPCSISASDFMVLNIQKSPTTNAGADATVCESETLALSGSAANYSAILWTTSGDGTFSSTSSPTTNYTPGTIDISNGSVNLTLTASAVYPCSISASDFMVLNIQHNPIAFAGPNATVLMGENYHLTNANVQYEGQILWQTTGSGTFESTTTVITIYNPSLDDYSNGSVVLSLTAIAVNPCVQNGYDEMILSFSAICEDALADAGDDFAVCLPAVVLVNGWADNYTGLLWQTSGDGTFENSSGLSTHYYPGQADILQGDVTLTLTAFATDPCSDASDEVMVEFINPPTVNAGNNLAVCLPDATVLSGTAQNAASTLWETNGDGTFSNPTALNTIYYPGTSDLLAMNVSLCLSATGNTPCTTAEDCLSVVYNQKPVPDAGDDVTVCEETVYVNLVGSATNYTSFAWSTTGDGIFLSSNSLTPKYKIGAGDKVNGRVNIILSAANSNCGAQTDTMQISILKEAFAYAGEDATICGNEYFSTTEALVENAESVLWETTGDGTFDNPNEVVTDYHPGLLDIQNGFAILCLTAYGFGSCPDDTWCMTLTLSTSAYVNAGTDQGICDSQTVQLNAVGSNYNAIMWETSGDGTFSSTSSLTPVYTPGNLDISSQQVMLFITATSAGNCGNASDALTVLIGHLPVANAGIDATLCENESIMLSGQAQHYTSVQWVTSGDGTFDNQNVTDPIYYPGVADVENESVVLILTAVGNSPCDILISDEININIQRIPDVNAGDDFTICQTETYQLSGLASNFASFTWITAGDGTFSPTGSLTTVYTPGIEDIENGWAKITLEATSGGPCNLTSTDFMYLVIDRFPEIVLDLEDTEAQIYSNVFLVIGAIDGDEYQWYGPTGLIPGADGSVLSLINVNADDAGYYYCTVSNNCGADTSNVIYLDVYVSHYISIPIGWSGLSSFVEPRVNEVESLFAPVTPLLITLENFTGCYWPGVLNTLVYYDPQDGYKAKFTNATIFEIRGSTNQVRTVAFHEGWNYLPVISTCPANVAELFGGNPKVQIMKEIAGMGIYWPSVGINTIGDMIPGRAYFIRVSESFSITYPDCPETKSSIITADVLKAKNNSLWNDLFYTPTTHIVAIDPGLYDILKPGDILGAFTPDGLCAGYLEMDGLGNGLSLFGDDPLTVEVDGFRENDPIRFKVYQPATGEESDLNVSFDQAYPNSNGFYTANGLSGIMKSATSYLSIYENKRTGVAIYPNPTTGKINISGLGSEARIEIYTTNGQLLTTITSPSGNENEGAPFIFDLSGFTTGILFLKIIESEKVEIRKIILQ